MLVDVVGLEVNDAGPHGAAVGITLNFKSIDETGLHPSSDQSGERQLAMQLDDG